MKLSDATISPAYGRDYKNQNDAKEAFLSGKDFVMESPFAGGGTYCSRKDFEDDAFVTIRYDQKRKSVDVDLAEV